MNDASTPARPEQRRTQRTVGIVFLVLLLLAGLGVALTLTGHARIGGGGEQQQTDDRPNIILFSSDDQRVDEMEFLPTVQKVLGAHGLTFSNAITPHPLCCPARAEILTGQLAQNNHVWTNFQPKGGYPNLDKYSTIGTDMSGAGYNTAFLGKPLNGYNNDDGHDPGWTIFNASTHGFSNYYDFTQFEQDHVEHVKGYYTDYVADKTVEYLHDLHESDKPFFMWVSHFAPHAKAGGPGCHDSACRHGPPPMSPSYRLQAKGTGEKPNQERADQLARDIINSPAWHERNVSDKPHIIRRQPFHSPRKVVRQREGRAAALASLDDAFSRMIDQLEADDELDNTYIVFITDNGYQLGEHNWFGKILPYEENVRTPMLVRGPGIAPNTTTPQIVSIVDLAATFLDIAHAQPTDGRVLDGRSMLPIWHGDREANLHPGGLLVQGGPFKPENGTTGWLFRGVRTGRYSYAKWYDGFVELYDRKSDPLQMHSVAKDPRYRAIRRELARRTDILKTCSGPNACNRQFGPLPPIKRR
ncbi:sulfatase family protein [Nocardioides acrostichi]|uniref:Sulfatase n=1 Tax=Nocardioides acrostichi TaxID=2784339 RepID=A0A930UY24_9ACTN|nr:sulfatase [Nocardioides acrostichi]MBF4161170.1 sulfatase [Nocardioides acrostichi]